MISHVKMARPCHLPIRSKYVVDIDLAWLCFRLQYFARQLQAYIKQLRVALQGKTSAELDEAENKIKCVALKTTHNINVLIRVSERNILTFQASVYFNSCSLLVVV